MGFLDSVRSWLKQEATELSDVTSGLEDRVDRDLTRRERLLEETPSEAMERLQSEIADGESSFDAIEDRIAHSQARADAMGDMIETEVDEAGTKAQQATADGLDGVDDVIDVEEVDDPPQSTDPEPS